MLLHVTFLTIVGTIVLARTITGLAEHLARKNDKHERPPRAFYFIPFIGALLWYISSPEQLFERQRRTRDSRDLGILTVHAAGRNHHIVTSPELIRSAKSLSGKEKSPLQPISISPHLLGLKAESDLFNSFSNTLTEISGPKKSAALSSVLLSALSNSLPDLLTLLASPVDQTPWERCLSEPPILSGPASGASSAPSPTATTDLFALLTNYFTYTLFSTLFPTNASVDQISLQPLQVALLQVHFDAHVLALGVHWLVPIGRSSRVVFARRRLLSHIKKMLALEREADVKALLGDDPEARPHVALTLIMQLAPAIWLASWAIAKAISSGDGASEIRENAKDLAKAWREEDVLETRGASRLELNFQGVRRAADTITTKKEKEDFLTILLRDVDTLYSGPGNKGYQSFFMERDILLHPSAEEADKKRWHILDGDVIHVFPHLPQAVTPSPPSDDTETEKPESPSSSLQHVVRDFVVGAVAGVFALWEVEPFYTRAVVPKPAWGLFICTPNSGEDLRVKIRRRDLPMAK